MSFSVIYYVCIACPTVERTLEMVDRYVAHGAKAFQIDMPSKDPFSETDFVKEMMKNTLSEGVGYDTYMDGIREIRRRHPELELHVVVYNDVVDAIGVEKFIAFGKEIGVRSFMIPGASLENFERIESEGTAGGADPAGDCRRREQLHFSPQQKARRARCPWL